MLVVSLLAPFANSAEQVEIKLSQLNVRAVYPSEVKTVGDGVKWLLQPTGYQIITEYPAPKSVKTVLSKPVPKAAEVNKIMPVLNAVQLLIGEKNTIILDEENRLISFSEGILK